MRVRDPRLMDSDVTGDRAAVTHPSAKVIYPCVVKVVRPQVDRQKDGPAGTVPRLNRWLKLRDSFSDCRFAVCRLVSVDNAL